MRAVITGPTGEIGIALIQLLIEKNIEVLAICHKGSNRRAEIPKSDFVHVLDLDMCDYSSFGFDTSESDDKRYDYFFHLAWEGSDAHSRDDERIQNQNIEFSLDAVNLAKRLGCSVFIGCGSQAEYGHVEGVLSPSTPTNPVLKYGHAKLITCKKTRELCKKQGLRHIWARFLSVYGPYDGPNSMISSSITAILQGQIPCYTPGEQMWDYLFSKDAANALLLLAKKGKDGKIYVIGSGVARPLKEYIYELRNEIDAKAEIHIGAKKYSDKQVMYLCADISELVADTGFQPEYKFTDGIRETIDYWRKKI